MSEPRRLGLLGGTFDPIHYGHLDAATAAQNALALDEIVLIPSHDPPHRPINPHATPYHRFALVALAVNDRPGFRVSDLELRRPGNSYTVDTLRQLQREGWQPSQLFFILGADAFAEIATWREYPDVLDEANFVVVTRPGMRIEETFGRDERLRRRLDRLGTRIVPVHAATRDVSSTLIRKRLNEGQSIDDLVPPAVARHILEHHLYEAVGRLHGENEHAGR